MTPGPPLTSTMKKLNMSVVWKDQGWGNMKGELFVRLMRPATKQPLKGGSLQGKKGDPVMVAEKREIFKHKEEESKVEIRNGSILNSAEPGDFYQ